MLKKYKLGFDVRGFVLFLIIMIPNFIWFAVPAPKDILRGISSTQGIDTIGSICQVVMIICLCILINKNPNPFHITSLITATVICCVLYFLSWIFYYVGRTNPLVILGLILPPCLAFLCYSIDRKNMVAIVPTVIFTICHLVYGIVNYII